MPRKKRSSSPFELLDDDFDEDASSQSSRNDNPPIQRNAANARERARMRVLSSAFGRLKTKLPNIPSDTKLSKLDTLRLATMYIKQLKAVVEGGGATAATNADHDMDGALNDTTPSCYLQLHSGAQSMNWPFGLHHQVNSSSSTRSHVSSCPPTTTTTNGGNVTTTSWCQTEGGNILKQSRYETENYHQHHPHPQQQQQNNQHHHHQHRHHQEQQSSAVAHHLDNASHSLTTTSSLTSLTTAQHSSQHHQEVVWYSETPSPDLSNSSSSAGLVGGYDSSLQQRHSLIEHLSHIQLTPPPHSSAPHHFQHQHQHHHHHHPHHQTHNQYSHHHDHLQHVQQNHQSLHQNFANTSNLAAASIR